MANKKSKPVETTPGTTTNVVSIVNQLAAHFRRNVWPEDIKDYKDYVVYTSKYDKNGKEAFE